MTPLQRRNINRKVLGSYKAVDAWLAVTDALQVFAHTQAVPAGTDVVKLYLSKSEECFKAQYKAIPPTPKANS